MRRVLIVTFGFPPTATSGVFRTLRYVKYLPAFGWEPLVVTVEGSGTRRDLDPSLTDTVSQNVRVVRTEFSPLDERLRMRLGLSARGNARDVESVSPRRRGRDASDGAPPPRSWIRQLWDLLFKTPDERIWWMGPAARAAATLIRECAPDVIYSTGPPHSTHLIAGQISRRSHLPLVADFRDPWARSPWRVTRRNPAEHRLNAVLERRLVARASQVVLNTERLADDFRLTYPEQREKFATITNGFDPADLPLVERLMTVRHADDVYTLCHPGTLYGYRDPRPLLDALTRVARDGPPIVFEQLGYHDGRFELDRWARNSAHPVRVRLTPRLSHDRTLEQMASADCLVVLQSDTPVQVPGKLFEMMMFRKPILTLATEGGTTDIVRGYELGAVADPRNTNAIEPAVRRLLATRSETSKGRWEEALKQFDGRRLTGCLAECLERAARAAR